MIRTILVDDERPALIKLKSLLLPYSEYQICGEFTSSAEALAQAEQLQPHVAFLDISMPGIDGLDLAVALQHKLSQPLHIVFVSAYDNYALTAFEVQATDYLLKPVSRSRFQQTILRLNQILNVHTKAPEIVLPAPISTETAMVHTFGKLVLSNNGKDHSNWKMAKVRELFAFFLHNRQQSIYRDTILATLWGHLDAEHAQSSMNTCNYCLRKILKESESGISLSYASNYYTLNMNGVICDLDIFSEACAHSSHITPENVCFIAKGAALYRGAYFEEIKSDWVELDRKRYAFDYVQLRTDLANYYYQQGNASEAEANAIQALDVNPIHNAAWKILLEVFKLYGNPSSYQSALQRASDSYRKFAGTELPAEFGIYADTNS